MLAQCPCSSLPKPLLGHSYANLNILQVVIILNFFSALVIDRIGIDDFWFLYNTRRVYPKPLSSRTPSTALHVYSVGPHASVRNHSCHRHASLCLNCFILASSFIHLKGRPLHSDHGTVAPQKISMGRRMLKNGEKWKWKTDILNYFAHLNAVTLIIMLKGNDRFVEFNGLWFLWRYHRCRQIYNQIYDTGLQDTTIYIISLCSIPPVNILLSSIT